MTDRLTLEGAQSTLRAVMARGVASALVSGIDNADVEGHALSEVQKTDLAVMAIMAYHDAVVEGESSLRVEAAISTLASESAKG